MYQFARRNLFYLWVRIVGVVLNHTSFEPQVPDTAPEQTVGLHVRGVALALNLPLLAGAVTNYARQTSLQDSLRYFSDMRGHFLHH